MLDLGNGFANLPVPVGKKVGILTWGGGWGVVAADFCEEQGLDVINLPDDIIEKLDKLLPAYWSKSNPIDLVGTLDRDAHLKCLEILVSCNEVDLILTLGVVASSSRFTSLIKNATQMDLNTAKNLAEALEKSDTEFINKISYLQDKYNKPIIGVGMLSPEYKVDALMILDV